MTIHCTISAWNNKFTARGGIDMAVDTVRSVMHNPNYVSGMAVVAVVYQRSARRTRDTIMILHDMTGKIA